MTKQTRLGLLAWAGSAIVVFGIAFIIERDNPNRAAYEPSVSSGAHLLERRMLGDCSDTNSEVMGYEIVVERTVGIDICP